MLPKIKKEFLIIIGVYIILTILVWGIFALDRGMWQDDILTLQRVQASKNAFAQLVSPTGTPTRILHKVPFTLAHWTGHVIFSLQFLYGLTWFSTGLLAHLLMLQLFPRRTLLAYLAGSLTLSATSDFLTNSLVASGIAASVAFYFASIIWLLKWWQNGLRIWLLPSGLCLYLSIWMYDAALASVILTPILFLALDDFRFTKRLMRMMIFWYGLFVPYLIVFINFLVDPFSYAAVALLPLTLAERFNRTLHMFINNFTPWVWALNRQQWFPALPSVLPSSFLFILALSGTIIFLAVGIWLWQRKTEVVNQSHKEGFRLIMIFLICILMTVSSNAIYSSVQFSEVFYRTHLVSRVWASLAVALLTYRLSLFAQKRWKYVMMILPTFFVGFGIYGGLERQDYYLGYWRQHRVELRSIVEQIPGLRPDARLILYDPPLSPYLATKATYLARCWICYLYGDSTLYSRVFLWAWDRNTSCKLESGAFICIGEEKEREVLPIDHSILLTYSPSQNRYILQNNIPTELLQDASLQAEKYNPFSQIVNKPLPDYAISILYGPEYIGALFHEKRNALIAEDETILSQYNPSKVNGSLRAGNIDLFESYPKSAKVNKYSMIHAAGWAFDPDTKKPAKYVVIVDNGKPFTKVPVNLNRKDVALTLNNNDLLMTGWDTVFSVEKLGGGKHRLEFYAFLENSTFAPLVYRDKIYRALEVAD